MLYVLGVYWIVSVNNLNEGFLYMILGILLCDMVFGESIISLDKNSF